MKTIDVINYILEMEKEIENLRFQEKIKTLENNGVEDNTRFTNADEELYQSFYDYGVDKLVNDCTYSFKKITATRKENGKIVFKEYNEWVDDIIMVNRLPDCFSKRDFLVVCEKRLKEMYQDECKKAYKRLSEQETKGDSTEDGQV